MLRTLLTALREGTQLYSDTRCIKPCSNRLGNPTFSPFVWLLILTYLPHLVSGPPYSANPVLSALAGLWPLTSVGSGLCHGIEVITNISHVSVS